MTALPISVGLRGRFQITATRPDGTRRVLAPWQNNLILDSGLERIGNTEWIDRCVVGTGSSTPAVSQTALDSEVAGTTNLTDETATTMASSPYTASWSGTFRFGQGDAAGNLSEVGVGVSFGSQELFSRALIKDGNGDPTTITVLSDEVLDVTYDLQMDPPQTDSTFQRTISGTTYDIVLRAADVGGGPWTIDPNQSNGEITYTRNGGDNSLILYDGDIGAITEDPSVNSAEQDSVAIANNSYVADSYQRTGTATAGLDDANFTNKIKSIRFITYWLGMGFQASFTPVIDKDNTKQLTLTVAVNWTRA